MVSVIDPPGVPEKKSFPPRLLLALAMTAAVLLLEVGLLVVRDEWRRVAADDPRKTLLRAVFARSSARASSAPLNVSAANVGTAEEIA